MEPWRARPVPFCLYGLRPPPATSPRVLVEWVPCRAAASWATTTWCRSGTFTWTSKISPGSSTEPVFFPAGDTTSTVLAVLAVLTARSAVAVLLAAMKSPALRGGTDEDERALWTGHSALDHEQALLGVHRVDGQALRGLSDVTHPAGHL